MTFAAPLFLLAALAGLIPVVLQLIHHQKAREVRFSTLRFLRISVQRTRRRKYIEDLSLLLVRVAVLVLIAVGLARPALTGLAAFWRGGRATAIAIVLDNSASMAVSSGGRTRFEAARQGVEQVLARLRPGDLVALVPTGGPPGPEHGRLFQAHETVRQALDQCRTSFERADLAARIQQAGALLAQAEAASKELYVFTDNQALSWENLREREPADTPGRRRTPDLPVVVVGVAGDPAPDVALRTLALKSPAPVAGAPFQAAVAVWNTATVPQQKTLELHLDGTRAAVSPTLSLPPGGTAQHVFRFVPDGAGIHRGEVRLAEGDGSPLDDRLYFALAVDQQIPVAIVRPRREEVPQADDAFYLERALAPAGSTGGAFRVASLTPEALATENLARHAVIFCVNLPALAPAGAGKLGEYARDGGHVAWICGRNVQPVDYNVMNSLAQGHLLPAVLEDLRRPRPGGSESWHVGFLDRDHPALQPLTEPASLYQSILVYQHFPMAWQAQGTGRVLARLDDGQPLLAERPVGSGSVLLLGTGVHVDWTNLPVKPLFLPLVTRLTVHLAGAQAERTLALAGAPVTIPLGTGTRAGQGQAVEVEVVRPSGEVRRVRVPEPAAGSFRYTDTHEPGVYLVRPVDGNPPKPLAFAVNIDPAEADPATIPRAELQARFGPRPLLFCADPAELADTIRRLREGTSLSEWFLTAVLIGLVFEVFLANRRTAVAQPLAGVPSRPSTTPPLEPIAPAARDEVHDFLKHLEEDAARAQPRD
jgi:hypothetical protein